MTWYKILFKVDGEFVPCDVVKGLKEANQQLKKLQKELPNLELKIVKEG